MKITIEPTNTPLNKPADCVNHKVIIEHPYDDLVIAEVLELIKCALQGYGFGETTIEQYLGEE